jgi:hypothetical protein
MKQKVSLIKEDGTIKGAWVATGVTALTFGLFTIGVFWDHAAQNLEKVGVYIAGSYSVSIGAYLLKKFKENVK